MAWSDVIDQQRVIEALRRTIASDRVAHAYLFHGRDGVGKRAVALAFARTLLCEEGGDAACDTCTACRKVARMLHPDVHVLLPAPTDAGVDDTAARLQALGRDPYAAVGYVRRPSLDDPSKTSNKHALYTVGRVHEELRRAMSFRPVEGRYKVAIVTDAERMRQDAANAFLKMLEEPGPRTVFILTTSRPERLLPTIVSRCQRLRFEPLSAEAIERALVARQDVPAAAAATLARMADGSYTRALELAESDDLMATRALVLSFFRDAYARDVDKLADGVDHMNRLGRERVKGLLALMIRWIRDLLLYRTMGDEAALVNVDQRKAIADFCTNLPRADLEQMVVLVEDAMELIERNVHTSLTLVALAHALSRAMRGPYPGRLYVPLAETGPAVV